MEYGTGAVMAVPAHDQRDFEFARKYSIPVRVVIQPEGEVLSGETMEQAWAGPGVMVASGPFDGTAVPEGIPAVVDYLEKNGMGEADVNYRLRDWLISRQRYWGAPIPIVHCPDCGPVPVPEEDLPVLLPQDVDFKPRGKSPLAFVSSFVNTTCPKCGHVDAQRETDTIAQWLCSCWYFLRYVSPHLDDRPYDRALVDEWLPVDLYIGGVEHAVLHLLYSRFVVKVLHDAGLVSFREPFQALFTQGMICNQSYTCTRCHRIVSDDLNVREPCRCELGMDIKERLARGTDVVGALEKMSKSKGNGVPIDQVIPQYGADTVRLYTLAIGPPEKDVEWQDSGIVGYSRFLHRLWDMIVAHQEGFARVPREEVDAASLSGEWKEAYRLTHATIKKVTGDIDGSWHFNTAIAFVITLVNDMGKLPLQDKYDGAESAQDRASFNVFRFAAESVVRMLAPFVPHICEELWERLGNAPSIFRQGWPQFDEEAARAEEVELPVQVNGRLRDRLVAPRDEDEAVIRARVLDLENVKRHLEGMQVHQVVIVPNRIVNVIAG
jgi:leucyl-tRNA synthetase